MTPMRTGYAQSIDSHEVQELVRWRRGPQPFKIVLQNANSAVQIVHSPARTTGYLLPKAEIGGPYPELVIEVPAACGGETLEDEAVYFFGPSQGIATVRYLVQPSAGDTTPEAPLPQRDGDTVVESD